MRGGTPASDRMSMSSIIDWPALYKIVVIEIYGEGATHHVVVAPCARVRVRVLELPAVRIVQLVSRRGAHAPSLPPSTLSAGGVCDFAVPISAIHHKRQFADHAVRSALQLFLARRSGVCMQPAVARSQSPSRAPKSVASSPVASLRRRTHPREEGRTHVSHSELSLLAVTSFEKKHAPPTEKICTVPVVARRGDLCACACREERTSSRRQSALASVTPERASRLKRRLRRWYLAEEHFKLYLLTSVV